MFKSSNSRGTHLGKRPASTAQENRGKKRATEQMEEPREITVKVKSQVIYLFLALTNVKRLVLLVLVSCMPLVNMIWEFNCIGSSLLVNEFIADYLCFSDVLFTESGLSSVMDFAETKTIASLSFSCS